MLDVALPDKNFSAFLYSQQAAAIIDGMSTLPIVVGGTGFYFDSLLYPPEYGQGSELRRAELLDIYNKDGIAALQNLLGQKDPAACQTVDMANYKRVIRAIEIAESGQSRTKGKGKSNPRYDLKLFVLERSRDSLYRAIEERVDRMIEQGLVKEVQLLTQKYGFCDTTAFEAIGYKEIIQYLKGEISLESATEKIKINTRHYAKRQISYYKRMNVVEYINVEDKTPQQIAQHICDVLRAQNVIKTNKI